MSTAVPPQAAPPTPTAPPSPSSAPAGGTPSGSPPPSSSPEPWRVPDTDPRVWARGKTSEEILGLVESQNRVITQHISIPTPPAPAPQTPPAASGQWTSDDPYATPQQVQSWTKLAIEQQVGPMYQKVIEQNAQTALSIAQRDEQQMFQRYGPEINAMLATVSKDMWTVDNVKKVVKLVKADHVEELARERAGQLAAENPGLLRSNGAAIPAVSSNQPDVSLKSERLPADYRDRLANAGVTESVMDEFLRANDMTREAFIQMIEKTAITEKQRG